jgi:hypothetical protein
VALGLALPTSRSGKQACHYLCAPDLSVSKESKTSNSLQKRTTFATRLKQNKATTAAPTNYSQSFRLTMLWYYGIRCA